MTPSANGTRLHRAVWEELEGWAREMRDEGCSTEEIAQQLELDYQVRRSRYAAALGSDATDPTKKDFRAIAESARLTRFITAEELETLPKPDFQIGDLWPVGGLVVPFGPPGAGKTFFTVGAALSLGTGVRFHGMETRSSPVVYVAAEGSGGMGARVTAWKRHRGWSGAAGVHFLTEPVNLLNDDDVQRFMVELLMLDDTPGLVVFDTLARCMIGGDENSALDMGRAIEAADKIRHATDATVLLVHHTNKGGDLERGSTALRGAADTMLSLKDEDGVITVRCEKQKDAEPFSPLRLSLLRVAESCVTEGATGSLHLRSTDLTPSQRQALEELHRLAPSHGLTSSKWEDLSQLARRTYYAARKALEEGSYVESDREGRGALYTLTPKGLEAVGAKVQEGANEGAMHSGDQCNGGVSPVGGPASCTDADPVALELEGNNDDS